MEQFKSFYGLPCMVFSKEVQAGELFRYKAWDELESRLEYMKKYRGLMLICADSGCGKTTALRCFIQSLSPQLFYPIYLPLSTVGLNDFYRQLNAGLCGERKYFKSEIFASIQNLILQFSKSGKIPLIIFDEAHLFKSENLLELQIITNFKCDSYDPAIFILSAQPHIMDRLSSAYLDSIYQRINLKYYLPPLCLQETKDYIIHQLKLKNRTAPIFNEAAYQTIFNISGGVLRKIGKLVTKTLILGAGKKKESLTEEEVMLAAKEL